MRVYLRGREEVRGESGEACAWAPFSLFSYELCLRDIFPCVSSSPSSALDLLQDSWRVASPL